MNEINQNSKRISELQNDEVPSDEDLILVERKTKDGTFSYSITYSDLKKQVLKKLEETCRIGSMCYYDKEYFSRFAHGHDYSDFYFYPKFGPQGKDGNYIDEKSVINVGQFKVYKYGLDRQYHVDNINVCVPRKKEQDTEEISEEDLSHKVGEIEMIGVRNFESYLTDIRNYCIIDYDGKKNIDINDNGFDGYVIPNGTTFSCRSNKFKDACRYFSADNNPNATKFTVPDLTHFFRINDGRTDNNAAKEIPFKNGVTKHTHNSGTMCLAKEQQESLKVKLDDGFHQYAGSPISTVEDNNALYGGVGIIKCRNEECGTVSLTAHSIELKNGTITEGTVFESSEEQDVESFPEYMNVPILIYIGK